MTEFKTPTSQGLRRRQGNGRYHNSLANILLFLQETGFSPNSQARYKQDTKFCRCQLTIYPVNALQQWLNHVRSYRRIKQPEFLETPVHPLIAPPNTHIYTHAYVHVHVQFISGLFLSGTVSVTTVQLSYLSYTKSLH